MPPLRSGDHLNRVIISGGVSAEQGQHSSESAAHQLSPGWSGEICRARTCRTSSRRGRPHAPRRRKCRLSGCFSPRNGAGMIADPVLRRRASINWPRSGVSLSVLRRTTVVRPLKTVIRQCISSNRPRCLDCCSQPSFSTNDLLLIGEVEGYDLLRPSTLTQLLRVVLFGNSNPAKSIGKWFLSNNTGILPN